MIGIRSCLSYGAAFMLLAVAGPARAATSAAAWPARDAQPAGLPAAPLPRTVDCPTGPISFVFIANNSIFASTDPNLEGRFGFAYRAVNALHVQTKEYVIRRELLFGPGDCYDEFLLGESERLLRGLDFLARVDIYGVPQPDGSYHVIVDTRDEWSAHVDVRVRMADDDVRFEGVRLQETNLLGTGQSVGAFYFERNEQRSYGVSYFTPQLLRTRWDLRADVGRSRAGTYFRQEIANPFVGEVSRWAARQSFIRDDRYFEYVLSGDGAPPGARLLLPVREKFFDLALLRRIGSPGNTTMIGGAIAHQELSFPGVPEYLPAGSFRDSSPADSAQAAPVLAQAEPLSNIRVFGVLAQRSIWWVKMRGLDSVRGQQDIALGGEALLAVGRSLRALEADDDIYATLRVYTGIETGSGVVIARGRADTRRNLDAPAGTPEWEDFFGEAELLAYIRSERLPGQTLLLRAAGAGAWTTRTPFQLTLGGERGVRGYGPERMPGGRRLLFTAENRGYFSGPAPGLFDLGGTLFVDVGRIWTGDVPFGADSGWRAAIGGGLRAAFPAGSRTTYRLDVALPIGAETSLRNWRVLLSVGELRGLADHVGDRQFLRSRPQSVAGGLTEFR